MDGVELIAPDVFQLEDADFLDINHVNPGAGRPKLTRQLATLACAREQVAAATSTTGEARTTA